MDFLPEELILKIAENLDYRCVLRLKQTSRRNYRILSKETRNLPKFIDLISLQGKSIGDFHVLQRSHGCDEEIRFTDLKAEHFEGRIVKKVIVKLEPEFVGMEDDKKILTAFGKMIGGLNLIHEFESPAPGDLFKRPPNLSRELWRTILRLKQHLSCGVIPIKFVTVCWQSNASLRMSKELADRYRLVTREASDIYMESYYIKPEDLQITPNFHGFMYLIERFNQLRLGGGGSIFGSFSVDRQQRLRVMRKLKRFWQPIDKFTKIRQLLPSSKRKMVLFVKDDEESIRYRLVHRPKPSTIESIYHGFNFAYLV